MNRSIVFLAAILMAGTGSMEFTGDAQSVIPKRLIPNTTNVKSEPKKVAVQATPQTPSLQEQFKRWAEENSQAPLKLLAPVPQMPQNSALQVTVVNPVPGRLALASYGDQQPPVTSLVFCTVGAQESSVAKAQHDQISKGLSCLTYPAKKSGDNKFGVLYTPSFSPDGRYTLFRYGAPWSGAGGYYLYVLDTQTNVVKPIPIIPGYSVVSWSPDSKYIALVEGGTADGGTSLLNSYVGPLKLYVCDWRNGKSQLVTTNDTVRGPFSWIAPHALIYGVLSPHLSVTPQKSTLQAQDKERNVSGKAHSTNKEPNALANSAALVESQPAIYEFSPDIGKSKLLFQDGYRPVTSSDGQWIAFFGSEHPEKPYPLRERWQDYPTAISLCVARRDGTGRKALDRIHDLYPPLYWLPDSQHLLTVKEVQPSPNVKIQIREWEITTGRWRQVALLEAKDYKFMNTPALDGHFQFLNFSKDGATFYIFLTEFLGRNAANNGSIGVAHLQAVNLNTGAVKTLVDIKGDSGADWHEDTAPATSTTAPKIP